MSTKTTVALDSDQMFWLGQTAREEIGRRYAARNVWRHPLGTIPARPEYVAQTAQTIRQLITAVRALDKAKPRAWRREALCRAA